MGKEKSYNEMRIEASYRLGDASKNLILVGLWLCRLEKTKKKPRGKGWYQVYKDVGFKVPQDGEKLHVAIRRLCLKLDIPPHYLYGYTIKDLYEISYVAKKNNWKEVLETWE